MGCPRGALHPAALASVSYGKVLVRVRARKEASAVPPETRDTGRTVDPAASSCQQLPLGLPSTPKSEVRGAVITAVASPKADDTNLD